MSDQPPSGKPKLLDIHNINKWWIVGGGAAAVLVFIYYRKHASATGVDSAATATDTTGQIDPVTGIPYGEEGSYGQAFGNPAAQFQGSNTFDAATGQWVPAGTVVDPAATVSSNDPLTPNWANVLYYTGDPSQDAAITNSSYLRAAYLAQADNPSPQNPKTIAYEQNYNAYQYAITQGKSGSATGR